MLSSRFKNDSKPVLKLNKIQLDSKSRVENNIQTGKYKFENVSCSICDSTDSELLAEKDRYGLEYHVVICKKCGLVFVNPRMTEESYIQFYDGEFRKLYVGVESPAKTYFYNRYIKSSTILNFIKSANPSIDFKGLNVLEIGCADGGILYYFKEQGCNVKGVDLGSEYLQYGRENYNLDLTQGSLKDVAQDFIPDIIIYSHVMEHVLNLDFELKQLREKCSDKTLIYIEVPGIKNLEKIYKMDSLRYFQNAHTHHFSLTSLTNLFVKHGFRLIKGNEHVRSVFIKENSIKKESIKNDYNDTLNYLTKTEKNRFIYPFKISTIKKNLVAFIKKNIITVVVSTLKIKTRRSSFID
jgi:2-polyprenyl-3-methyl-5-hydroxy-6-metoxy-1,4-benzoquinol methylase